MKIVVTKDFKMHPDQKDRLGLLGEVAYYEDTSSPEQWYNRCADAGIICSGRSGLDGEEVYKLQNVFISLPFVGAEFLDLERLKERNISVSNAPGCNREAVVEWIVGMILMRFRRLHKLVQAEKFSKDENLETGLNIWNKNITILGAGNIGQHLNTVLTAFGAQTSMFRRGDDLLQMIEGADMVINCLPANKDTIGLLDTKFFQGMKSGSFFASVARSQTYDIDALIAGLDTGLIAGALDDAGDAPVGDAGNTLYQKLQNHSKILVTPHIAWNSESETRKANDIMIDNVEAWLSKRPQNILT